MEYYHGGDRVPRSVDATASTALSWGLHFMDSGYDGKIEDAKVTTRMNAKPLNQLSSSAEAAQQNWDKNAILSLGNAVQNFKDKEEQGSVVLVANLNSKSKMKRMKPKFPAQVTEKSAFEYLTQR